MTDQNDYAYNDRGELVWRSPGRIGAVFPDGPVWGWQEGLSFDNIGNRTSSTVKHFYAHPNGDFVETLIPNALNQIVSRTVPPYAHVRGAVPEDQTPSPSVTVAGNAASKVGRHYWYPLQVNNQNLPAFGNAAVTVTPPGPPSGTSTNSFFVPRANETFLYDADGNLKEDSRWFYVYDGENRLIWMESKQLPSPSPGVGRSNTIDPGAGQAITRSYAWKPDLSGTLHGAGGVGGLGAIVDHTAGNKAYFVHSDILGNVTHLLDASSGALVSELDYLAFGQCLAADAARLILWRSRIPHGLRSRQSIPLQQSAAGDKNHFRFSSKFEDPETGLIYYGYRWFSPSLGRWLGRDPIGEPGGLNLFAFVENSPSELVDPLGLEAKMFTADVATLPLSPEPMGTGRIARGGITKTDYSHRAWISYALLGWEWVKIASSLEIKILYNSDLVDDPYKHIGIDERTIAEHEKIHAGHAKAWWNGFVMEVNPFEEVHCSPCGQYAVKIADAAFSYYVARYKLDAEYFDCSAYPQHGGCSGVAEAQADVQQSQRIYVAAWKKFNDNACNRP